MQGHAMAILRTYLADERDGSIQQITGIEFEIAAEIPLRISFMDKGGNYHSIGYTNEWKLVTFEV